MTKVLVINSCYECPYLRFKESMFFEPLALCTNSETGIYQVQESISENMIPEWCPLEDKE